MKNFTHDQWWTILFSALVAFLAVVLCTGCASLGSGTRGLSRVEVKDTYVVIPASAETPAQVIPVRETTRISEDETTTSTVKTSPDYDQLRPVAQMVGMAAGGTGLGQILGAGAALAVSTATAWLARGPAIKAAKDAAEYHKQDAEEGYRMAQANAQRAEEYARQLPPKT
jgi:uncharacterized protein YcfJ